MKKVILVGALVLIAAAIFWKVKAPREDALTHYRLVAIAKGDLASVVTSTGTLQPVTTVQVGTQVSGRVDEILADFNDSVKAGQVIARIDTTLLASAVASASAQLQRSEAELKQAQREYNRMEPLYREKMVSESDLNTAQYNLDVAKAGFRSAQVDRDRARRNLSYATITSPINGTVIQRTVDVGQTVQASFSAPELFLIAGDLTQMQILASVDESDIGQIVVGQNARFTVQAYPNDTFTGVVRQVRLQSVVEDNVVNYQVVVSVANPDLRLLPGMTATVDFIIKEAKDIMYVANSALRFKPSAEEMAAVLQRKRAERGPGTAPRDSAGKGRTGTMDQPHGNGERGTLPPNRGMLWVTQPDGTLDVIMVHTGISDGTNTAVEGRNLEPGTEVIAGVASQAATEASSPFQQQNSRSGPPRPGGF